MLSKRQLDKLNKTELVAYALNLSDLHEKFSTLEKSLTDSIIAIEKDFKEQFELYKVRTNAIIDDLTSQLEVSKNTSTVLRDDLQKRLKKVERQSFRSAEYLNYETIEISKIPLTVPDDEIPGLSLKIVNSLYSGSEEEFGLDDVHAIHRRQGHYSKEKVLMKFVRRGDAFQTLKRAKELRKTDLRGIDVRLTEKVFLNEHLSPYYSKLRYVSKLLKEKSLINDFWVSGHKLKIKTSDDEVKIISHKDDLLIYSEGDITVILNAM